MKVKFNFGDSVLSLPHSVIDKLSQASENDIKILLALASGEDCVSELGYSQNELDSAVSFWRGAGVLTLSKERKRADNELVVNRLTPPKEKPLASEDKLPEYSAQEVKRLFATTPSLAGLLDACQQTCGKVFNNAECAIILGLHDHLNLDSEYIITLLAYCAGKGKKSLRYAEKMALSLTDMDIDTPATLEAYLKKLEAADTLEGKLRSMFGISDRALSKKEKDCFLKWSGEWMYTLDMISRAYEATVNAIGKASIPYTDAIMAKWHAAGCRTLDDVEKYDKGGDRQNDRNSLQSSFETDDFFESALKRSYSQMKKNTEDK